MSEEAREEVSGLPVEVLRQEAQGAVDAASLESLADHLGMMRHGGLQRFLNQPPGGAAEGTKDGEQQPHGASARSGIRAARL